MVATKLQKPTDTLEPGEGVEDKVDGIGRNIRSITSIVRDIDKMSATRFEGLTINLRSPNTTALRSDDPSPQESGSGFLVRFVHSS